MTVHISTSKHKNELCFVNLHHYEKDYLCTYFSFGSA